MKNKKGFIGDYMFYMIYIFVFAIFLTIIFLTFSILNDSWQNIDGVGTTSKTILNDYTTKFDNVWDWVMVFWLLGFVIVLVIIGLVLRTHPVFMSFAMIGITIVGGIISVHLSNAWQSFASSPTISTYTPSFGKISYILNNYPYIIIALSGIFLIVLFSKSRSDIGI